MKDKCIFSLCIYGTLQAEASDLCLHFLLARSQVDMVSIVLSQNLC